mgnify:CR=1 FL=1
MDYVTNPRHFRRFAHEESEHMTFPIGNIRARKCITNLPNDSNEDNDWDNSNVSQIN